MTQTKTPDVPMATGHAPRPVGIVGIIVRIALPIAALSLGIVAYQKLSIEVDAVKEPPAEVKQIRTRVVELRSLDYPIVIKKNGIIQPHNQVLLSAEVTGQVVQVSPKFEVGSYFAAGEVLVQLDDRDYRNAVALTEAQHDGAQAALELATLDLERQQKLLLRNAASVAELNQAAAARAQAESALQVAKTQVDQANRDLERTKIVAPFNGRVRQKDLGLGQSVGPGTPLGIVFAIDFAEVRLPIAGPEVQYFDLPELEGDAPVDVELRDAINPDSKTVWKARIVRTEGTLDENSLEWFAIARIDDPFGLKSGHRPLRIGQPVIGSIKGKRLENVIAIPRTSVRQMDQVYLIDHQTLTINAKTITPIWSDPEYILIRDPSVPDGTLVATTRIVYAPDGAKVEIISDLDADSDPSTQTASKKVPKKVEATN